MLQIPKKKRLGMRDKLVALCIFVFMCLGVRILLTPSPSFILTEMNFTEVSKGDLEKKITGFGRLVPRQSVAVLSEVTGIISSVALFPGSSVNAGDEILTMRNPTLSRSLQIAELELLQAQAQFENAQSELVSQETELLNAVEIHKSNVRFAKQEVQKLKVLVDRKIVSELDYLKANTNLEQSQLKLKLSERNLQTFGSAKATKIRVNEVTLAVAKKRVEIIKDDLSKLVIKAPVAGVLSGVGEDVNEGQRVTEGQFLMKVINPNSLYANILVTASEASEVKIGQQAIIDIRNKKTKSSVKRIHPSVTNNQVLIELVPQNAFESDVRENLDVAGAIIVARKNDVLLMGRPLHVSKPFTPAEVFVLEGDVFQKTVIEVGMITREQIEVLSNIKQASKIVLDVPKNNFKHEKIKVDDWYE